MTVIAGSILIYLIGAVLTLHACRILLSPPMLAIFYFGQYLCGGIYYTIACGHTLTMILPAFGSLLFGIGAMLARSLGAYVMITGAGNGGGNSKLFLPKGGYVAYKAALGFGTVGTLVAAYSVYALRGTPLTGTLSKVDVAQGIGPLVRITVTGLQWSLVLWSLAYKKWRQYTTLFVIAILVISNGVVLTLLGYKGYMFDSVLFVLMVMACAHPDYVGKVTVVILLALAVASAIIVLYLSPGPARGSLALAISMLWKRFSVGSSLGLDFLIYSWMPISGVYLGETWIWDLTGSLSEITQGILFPLRHPYFTTLLSNQILGYQAPYAVTIGLIGDLYANFGIAGVVLGIPLFGAIMQVIHSRSSKAKKHMLLWPIYVWVGFTLAQGSSTGSLPQFLVSRLFSLILFYSPIVLIYLSLSLPFVGTAR